MPKATSEGLKLVKRIDRNTRALAKVVSAAEWIRDEYAPTITHVGAIEILERCKFEIVQLRRNLREQLWAELKRQEEKESRHHG